MLQQNQLDYCQKETIWSLSHKKKQQKQQIQICEYDQEIPQSQTQSTADKPRSRATQQPRDKHIYLYFPSNFMKVQIIDVHLIYVFCLNTRIFRHLCIINSYKKTIN